MSAADRCVRCGRDGHRSDSCTWPVAPGAGRPIVLAGSVATLTKRQMDVLQAASQGLTMRKSAQALGVGYETIKSHRSAICCALDVPNIVAAVAAVSRAGLL